jgi:sugar lactone lactonase YvrE
LQREQARAVGSRPAADGLEWIGPTVIGVAAMAMTPLVTLCLLVALAGGVRAHPPAAGPLETFAEGLAGPEGLAFARDGLVVGSTTGEIRRFARDGSSTVLADVGESLAGITVLRDGRVLAAAFGPGRVWSVDRSGTASVLASGVAGANFVVEARAGQILASASIAGTVVDIATGTPVERALGLAFPNGLAITKARALGRGRFLYVAETAGGRVSRLRLGRDGTLGPAEIYATGLTLPDGIAFDRRGNLLVVGGGQLNVVVARTREVVELSTDPLLDFPSNLAFGRGRGFRPTDVYLANFGPRLGDGTSVVRFRYNHPGAR